MNLIALSDADIDRALTLAEKHLPPGSKGGLIVFANTQAVDVAVEYNHDLGSLGGIDVNAAFEWQYGRKNPEAGAEVVWHW